MFPFTRVLFWVPIFDPYPFDALQVFGAAVRPSRSAWKSWRGNACPWQLSIPLMISHSTDANKPRTGKQKGTDKQTNKQASNQNTIKHTSRQPHNKKQINKQASNANKASAQVGTQANKQAKTDASKQSKAKQSKAKQSKAKQSKAKQATKKNTETNK